MINHRMTFPAILCLCLAVISTAFAADSDPIEVTVQAELRVAEREGTVTTYRYVPAAHFDQGQQLYYTVRIRNTGDVAVRDALVVQPIPLHTRYVAGSASGAGAAITYSVDGGRRFAVPDELRIASDFQADTQDGPVSKRATAGDYTHIRWQLRHPLEPGAVVLARFRVVFD